MIKTKKIKVGGQTFKLVRNDAIYADHHTLGRCFKDRGVIEYAGGFPNDVTADTILHEVLHAVWGSYVEQQQADEETVVTMLAHGLCQVIRDNKKFIEEVTDLL